ncbi:preprotein translocase subunit TatC [Pontibacillus halophilus JSM 076056 = DSM 19796]|uniref:Sec-independent protein translocase protein TatC n=1 Tax=Pontibacillus halophilus JSM 076056 = DSM 19796 TaxID=1385510 RepID=A0A0A5GIW8_9BACI|nr:twin-arginine translocase subunit TatC [Pontibacillus halophilus]KGX91949.1 preprotein translocase subunit TatC [Pontibacillus halophilus JSM 076056 = DSM 19796]
MLDEEMNVTEHLGELRNRLLWTFAIFVTFFIAGFIFVEEIYSYFVRELEFELTILGPAEIIWIFVLLASMVAITATLPFLCLQIWFFVKPALTDREKKVSLAYIPAIFLLFVGGLAFGYYVIQPLIFHFLLSLGEGLFETMFTVEKYFQFLIRVTLPFAVLFEIPILIMFLTSLGIVEPQFLRKVRKYAYFVLIIVGTMISPPDFILQLVVALPLIVLYEVSILLSSTVYRRKKAKETWTSST